MKRTIAFGVAAVGLVLFTAADGAAGDCDSIPATKTVTEDRTFDSLCNATCGALSRINMSGPIASGTNVGAGRLEWVDQWHGQCRINGGPLNGQCSSDTTCLPGQTRFQDGGVWKCKSSVSVTVPNADKATCLTSSAATFPDPPNASGAREVGVMIARDGGVKPASDAKWRDLLKTTPAADVATLIAVVLRESKKQADADKRYYVDKIAELNRQKAAARAKLDEIKAQQRKVSKQSANDADIQTKRLEAQLQKLEDDAQLANVELQNMLQKQQQMFQTISNISKMLHDTAMAVIRNLRG